MPIPRSAIGTELAPITLRIDESRLRFFAKSIGETNPIYYDMDAARRAGHPSLPAPLTFLFGLQSETGEAVEVLERLGVDLRYLLHGQQTFTYHSTVYAGDEIILRQRVTDVYEKKGGALEFFEKTTFVTRTDDSPVADLTMLLVVRHPEIVR